MDTIVFRVVLANPLTSCDILEGVLKEQRDIAETCTSLIDEISKLAGEIVKTNAA